MTPCRDAEDEQLSRWALSSQRRAWLVVSQAKPAQSDSTAPAQGVGLLGLRHWSSTGFAMPPPPGQWAAQVSTALRLGAANADAATESSLTQQQAKALLQRWHRAKAAALSTLIMCPSSSQRGVSAPSAVLENSCLGQSDLQSASARVWRSSAPQASAWVASAC